MGDAFGDLGRTESYRNQYGIVNNLYAGAKSTDDTEFAVLTAQILIDCGGQLTPKRCWQAGIAIFWMKTACSSAAGAPLRRGGQHPARHGASAFRALQRDE